jgi:hypothetical protein
MCITLGESAGYMMQSRLTEKRHSELVGRCSTEHESGECDEELARLHNRGMESTLAVGGGGANTPEEQPHTVMTSSQYILPGL